MNNKIRELDKNEELKLEKNIIWIFGLTDPALDNGYFTDDAANMLSRQISTNGNNLLENPLICKDLGMLKVGVKDVKMVTEWRTDSDYFFSHIYSETWKFYLRKLILNRIYSQFKDLSKKIIVNESKGIGSSSIISECLPNSKIIFLVQNEKAAVDYSTELLLKDKNKLVFSSLISKLDREEAQKIVSRRWKKLEKIMMQVYNSHSEGFRYIVNLEDLNQSPHDEMEKILKFILLTE